MRPQTTTVFLLTLSLSGCWKESLAELELQNLAFEPEGSTVEGWGVFPVELALTCPDGESARMYVVAPIEPTNEEMPVAIIFHPGAFDYVSSPDPSAPLEGAHFATPSRLGGEFAVHEVFSVLGMYPESLPTTQTGALPKAFAERGVVTLLPTNCWGDLWHNVRGLADNKFDTDFFFRDGRAMSEWSMRILVDPLFADALRVELPFEPKTDEIYTIGLGTGSRAIGELLRADFNEDGITDLHPAGILLDSPFDDLSGFYAERARFGDIVAGLDRIAPSGEIEAARGQLSNLDLPEKTGLLYSETDDTWPLPVYEQLAVKLSASPNAWIEVDPSQSHLRLNDDSSGLAATAVSFLLD